MGNLIIPMFVEAYASGSIRTSQRDVPRMAPDYKTVMANSVLGSRNTPGAFEKEKPLEPGVHLHFILPDAFTHSADGEDYPAAPNRYAVTRIWGGHEGDKLQAKCFIVESDFISLDKSYGKSITIPFFEDPDDRRKWRYLGRSYPAGQGKEMGDNEGYLDKLTAVGAGDMLFAAYYPNCRSVFGFHDDLSDLPIQDEIKLTYFVMGYFSDETKDPFSGVKTVDDFEKILQAYGLCADVEEGIGNRTIVYGMIDSILWKGFSHDYAKIPEGKVNIVFGNNSAEALSKMMKKFLDPDSRITERMLTALQYELYDGMGREDGNFFIDDQIHYHRFARYDSLDSSIHISVDQDTGWDSNKKSGSCISDIKKLGRETGDLKRRLLFSRGVLFTLWEQYVLLYEDGEGEKEGYLPKQELLDEMRKTIRSIRDLEAGIKKKEEDYKARIHTLSDSLPKGAECEKNGSEFFFAAKDPALLLSGEGVRRTFAFGEDGRFTPDGLLECQIEAVHTDIGREDFLEKCMEGTCSDSQLPPAYADLLMQTCLLGKATLEAVSSLIGEIKIEGRRPSRIAVNEDPFDFATLCMIWGIEYYPTRTNEEKDNTLDGWRLEYGDTDLVYQGGLTPRQLKKYKMSGQILLTPHAVKTLGSVMERYAGINQEEELGEMAEKVKNLPVISQNLSGFGEFFGGFWQALQFPVMGIGGDEEMADLVSACIGDGRKSILPHQDLLPMHGGYMKLTDLALVSTFGLTQPLVQKSYYNGCEVDFAETVSCEEEDYGLLRPSFSDFARLNADFTAAADDEVLSSTAPETSPVCGIVIPEILNRRLLIYDADGDYKGMVKTVYRNRMPEARWISAPDGSGGFAGADFGNDMLRDFVKALLQSKNAFYEFNALMDRFLDSKHGTGRILWGRPLALVRMKVCFEFYGHPQYKKGFEDIKKYDRCGIDDVKFGLGIGDMGRISDGVFGYFDGNDFSKLYPPFGADHPHNLGDYVQYGQNIYLSSNGKDRYLTLLAEPDSPITIQTGLLPVKTVQIEAAHTKALDRLSLSAEISPLLKPGSEAAMPALPLSEEGETYQWYYVDEKGHQKQKVILPAVSFDETILTDGFIMKDFARRKKGRK